MEGYELKQALKDAGYEWAARSLDPPSDFGYWGDTDLFNTWGLCFTLEHRDSGPLEQSNSAIIKQRIKDEGLEDSFEVMNMNHWAVGWVEQLAIKLVTDDGALNLPAIEFMQRIKDDLDVYPILNEEDYSQREYEDLVETLEKCYRWDLERNNYDLPDDWIDRITYQLGEWSIGSSEELSYVMVASAAHKLGWWHPEGYCYECRTAELPDADDFESDRWWIGDHEYCHDCYTRIVQDKEGWVRPTLLG